MADSGNNEESDAFQNTVRNVTEAKEFCFDLVRALADLENSRRDAEALVKCREVELEEQRNLAIFNQSEINRLLEENMNLKNGVQTLKATNESQQTEIIALNAKIKSLEESLGMVRKGNRINKQSEELLAKHRKLRMFVKLHVAILQTLVKTVQSYSGESKCASLNKKVTSLTARFTKRIVKVESTRSQLLQNLRYNREMIVGLANLLKISIPTKIPHVRTLGKLRCRICSQSVTSWKNLQAHQKVVHIVQKSRKFLQKQAATRRQNVYKVTKRSDWYQNKTYDAVANSSYNVRKNLLPGTIRTIQHGSCGTTETFASTLKPTSSNLPTCAEINLPVTTSTGRALSTDTNHCSKSFQSTAKNEKTQSIHDKHTLPETLDTKTPSISIPTQSTSQHQKLYESFSSVKSPNFTLIPIQSSVPPTQTTEVWKTREHAFSHADQPGIYSCKCGLKFESMDTLDIHARYFVLGKRFPCSYCDERFQSLAQAKLHAQKAHHRFQPKSIYMGCQSCGVIFLDRRELRKHLVAPNGKKYFGSCVCPMKLLENQRPPKLVTKGNVNRIKEKSHQAGASTIASNLKPKFACRVCRKQFLYARVLSAHLVSKHKVVENLGVGCYQCGEFFLDYLELRKHHRIVHFAARQQVKKKYTSTKAQTQQNSNMDSKLAPLTNQSQEASSQMHAEAPVKIVDKKLTFPCICGKSFSSKSSRGLHIRTKLIGEIFVCSYCPAGHARYAQYGNLKSHIRQAHPEFADKIDDFACWICGKTFGRRDEALSHKAMDHPRRK